jgi:hypothetical protein
MKNHRTIAVLAAACILGVSACGDDVPTADGPDTAVGTVASVPATTHSGTHTDTDTDTDTSSTPSPASPIDDGVLTVELSDFAFDGLPESVPAGTRLAVENTSPVELHELVALRIADTETRSAAELMALPEDQLRAVAGPAPATVLVVAPGGRQIAAVGDGTLTEPGRYLLLCAIPTGADPAEYVRAAAESAGPPDVPGGPPHFVHGMFAEIIVE